jgi:hypothetical protein
MGAAALVSSALGAAALLAAVGADAGPAPCARRPGPPAVCVRPSASAVDRCRRTEVQAPCFIVRARLGVANGTPSFRLSRLGSRRILGVFGADGDAASPDVLPPSVMALAAPPTPGTLRTVVGDFRVCPPAQPRAGWMQPVCIASAARLSLAADQPKD